MGVGFIYRYIMSKNLITQNIITDFGEIFQSYRGKLKKIYEK